MKIYINKRQYLFLCLICNDLNLQLLEKRKVTGFILTEALAQVILEMQALSTSLAARGTRHQRSHTVLSI